MVRNRISLDAMKEGITDDLTIDPSPSFLESHFPSLTIHRADENNYTHRLSNYSYNSLSFHDICSTKKNDSLVHFDKINNN